MMPNRSKSYLFPLWFPSMIHHEINKYIQYACVDATPVMFCVPVHAILPMQSHAISIRIATAT